MILQLPKSLGGFLFSRKAMVVAMVAVLGIVVPYARAAVSHLVTQGGFPQFLLPPVNFDALYAQSANQPVPATTN